MVTVVTFVQGDTSVEPKFALYIVAISVKTVLQFPVSELLLQDEAPGEVGS